VGVDEAQEAMGQRAVRIRRYGFDQPRPVHEVAPVEHIVQFRETDSRHRITG
jgi:hypothetical protein